LGALDIEAGYVIFRQKGGACRRVGQQGNASARDPFAATLARDRRRRARPQQRRAHAPRLSCSSALVCRTKSSCLLRVCAVALTGARVVVVVVAMDALLIQPKLGPQMCPSAMKAQSTYHASFHCRRVATVYRLLLHRFFIWHRLCATGV
jgi:hypothetical protein